MKHFISRILSSVILCEGMYELAFSWNDDAPMPLPGQFCTIRVSKSSVPLLRRPFAFSAFDKSEKTASIVFKKVGASTEILASKKCGDTLDIIGPLGNSFIGLGKTRNNILVAGGTGFGPILFWNRFLQRKNISTLMVVGSATKAGIPVFKKHQDETIVFCTEDGSQGFRGTVVDYLRILPEEQFHETTLYCCGPRGMLKSCHDLALRHGSECFLSMEQTMACGVGACMGCAVKVSGNQPYARVCREGPIFNSRTIVWT
jgi:dihydroorotate dehydrogenase electron transfer subunit